MRFELSILTYFALIHPLPASFFFNFKLSNHILQFLGESVKFGMINSLNKVSVLKISLVMTCDLLLAQQSMAPEWFSLSNLTCMAWVNPWSSFQTFPIGAAWWDCLPRLITSRSHFPDRSTMGRSRPESHGQNANILTTWSGTIINIVSLVKSWIALLAEYKKFY